MTALFGHDKAKFMHAISIIRYIYITAMIIMVHNESIIHTTHNNYYDYVYIIIVL